MVKQLILTFDAGGLCNRLFPFANALAVGLEHGFTVVNPSFRKQIGYFVADIDNSLRSEYRAYRAPQFDLFAEKLRSKLVRCLTPNAFKNFGETEAVDLEALVETANYKTLWVSGLYLLAPKLFPKHSPAIRSFFRPIPELQSDVSKCLKSARENCDVLVGVHIRQGDYAQHDSGMLFYSSEEYVTLMKKMVTLHPEKRVKFLICSNVPQPSHLFSELEICFSPGHEVIDLYALAGCDYLIGAPSSYSQWASFYGEVPRFVHNRKYEEKLSQPITKFEMENFHIHRKGFGRFLLDGCPI